MIRYAGSDNNGSPPVQKIGTAGVQVEPERKFTRELGLVKIAHPHLIALGYFFLDRLYILGQYRRTANRNQKEQN
jgi:hypothetical protein